MPPITPGDIGSVVNQLNQNIAQQNTDAITKVFKDDTGQRRVLLGKGANGFYGLKVSKDGKDVFTAADSDLIFNSGQDVLKVVGKGTVTVTALVNQGSFNAITHNLGFVPMVMATCQGPTTYVLSTPEWAMVPYISFPDTTSKVVTSIAHVNTTILQFEVELGSAVTSAAGIWTFNYYLLQETAT